MANVTAATNLLPNAYEYAKGQKMKRPTKKEARALRVGDVIEVFYKDMNESSIEIVLIPCGPKESIDDVRAITKEEWQNGTGIERDVMHVNSEYWRKIGRMNFDVI